MSKTSVIATISADQARLTVVGEIDLLTVHQLTEAGLELVSSPDVSSLDIDLFQVTFLDSTGLGGLIEIRNATLRAGKHLVLSGVSDRVKRVLTITGLATVFELTSDAAAEPLAE